MEDHATACGRRPCRAPRPPPTGLAGELLINSSYDAELEEVSAFEELVGSHGGFGGPQTRPFLLAPAELEVADEPIVGAPAVHRQLVSWADALGVGPGSGAGDSPVVEDRHLPEPKGIKWVAALLVLYSVPAILFAGLLLVLEVVSAEIDALATAAIVVALLIAVASIGLAVGLRKRRRWAWFVTLLFEGLSVLAMLFGLATQGLGAVASYGILSMVVAFTVFYYLTRPHVAAAFRRRPARP